MEDDVFPFLYRESMQCFLKLQEAIRDGNASVVIGAGLSIQAGLPGWESLVEELASRGSASTIGFNPYYASDIIDEIRESLGVDYVSSLRELLDPPGLALPASYRALGDVPFKRFATTNIDELLYTLAVAVHGRRDETIYEYPARDIEGKRYLYLHGRLRSAVDGHSLVLGSIDYDRAYDLRPGPARHVLNILLEKPVLFVGTSLEDPMLRPLLREIHKSIAIDRKIGDRTASRIRIKPPWFALLPANPKILMRVAAERFDLLSKRLSPDEFRSILIDNAKHRAKELDPVQVIWYEYDRTHSNLRYLIERLQSMAESPNLSRRDHFLALAPELEGLGRTTDPTPAQIERIRLLLRVEANRHHFFRHASPTWLPILWDSMALTNFPEPETGEDGNVYVSGWDAGAFVTSSASAFPDVALEIVNHVRTQNWLAISDLARTLHKLPRSMVPLTLESVDCWLSSTFVRSSTVGSILLDLIQSLTTEEEWSAALQLFAVLAQWKISDQQDIEPRLHAYEYQVLITDPGRRLSKQSPIEVLTILEKELRRVLERSSPYFSRAAIEDSDQDMFPSEFDWLVIGIRDALLDLADLDDTELVRKLDQLLKDQYPLFRRLALFVLTEKPYFISRVDSDRVLPPDIFDYHAYHEQMRFLRIRFLELPNALQTRVHKSVSAWQDQAEVSDHRELDERLMRAWLVLNVLPIDVLTERERIQKEVLDNRFGPPEHPLFLSYSSGLLEPARAPATALDLQMQYEQEGLDGLLDMLRHPDKFFQLDWPFEADLLWGELAANIVKDPNKYLTIAARLELDDFPAAWRYLHAYEEASRQGEMFPWKPLVDACYRLAHDSKSSHAYLSLARLIRRAAWDRTNPVEIQDLDVLEQAAVTILGKTATPLSSASSISNGLPEHQLNSAAGASADAVMGILHKRTLESSNDQEMITPFPERIRLHPASERIVNHGVDTGWGGLELRFAIGEHLPLLLWAYPGWLKERLSKLLPCSLDAAADLGAWRGFWSGYLETRHLYELIMSLLCEAYAIVTADSLSSVPRILTSTDNLGTPRGALARHLSVAWLRGYQGFGLDGILGTYVEHASDETRAKLTRQLVGALREANSTEDREWGDRVASVLDAYWEERVHTLSQTLGDGESSKELSAFVHWLPDTPKGLEDVESRLSVMIRHLKSGFEFHEVSEFLLKHVHQRPSITARLLFLLTDKFIRSPEVYWYGNDLPALVRTIAAQTTDATTRTTLRGIVNDLLERRGIDLRRELETQG